MKRIHGITITLYNKTQTGEDAFHVPVYEETPEAVENVLVGEPSTEDIANTLNLTGRRLQYWLAIPKGDTHEWEDRRVELPGPFAGIYRTFGGVIAGIEENIPLSWNKKVMIERYHSDDQSGAE